MHVHYIGKPIKGYFLVVEPLRVWGRTTKKKEPKIITFFRFLYAVIIFQ